MAVSGRKILFWLPFSPFHFTSKSFLILSISAIDRQSVSSIFFQSHTSFRYRQIVLQYLLLIADMAIHGTLARLVLSFIVDWIIFMYVSANKLCASCP